LSFVAALVTIAALAQVNALVLSVSPLKPRQGDTLAFHATLPDSKAAIITFRDRVVPMERLPDGRFRALFGTSPDMPPGLQTVTVLGDDGGKTISFALTRGTFGVQRLRVPAARNQLRKDPRVDADKAAIRACLAERTPDQLWQGAFAWPVTGSIRTQYGLKRIMNGDANYGWHKGYDIAAKTGTPIKTPADGIVALVRPCVLEGNLILVNHGQGVYTAYFHLSKFSVAEGQTIRTGERLGHVGNTGISSGPHLHWGVYVNGVAVNPKPWLTAPPK